MDDIDDSGPTPGSPFLWQDDSIPAARTPYFQPTATLRYYSQTTKCGVYCSGMTRRHGEDRFYSPHAHRFLAGTAILFDLANFAHDDDYGIVQALQDSGGGINTYELNHGLVVYHRRLRCLPLKCRRPSLQRRLRLLSPIHGLCGVSASCRHCRAHEPASLHPQR
ncbi:hypothetical protein IW261DRAFT_1508068 [Armillaria novae-zelandiae]|uniref:Uncharacterized protein n=1 Tax=Armillaria novae-zelandiae TaxID=153914 RepID=A0AA39NUY0_9AGAR|nr:hypothetical protein IW261DRAFT_1508068 [Armillaria novae-zelandiae]